MIYFTYYCENMVEVTVKLDFTEQEIIKIDQIKGELDFKNNAEVVSYAVDLLLKLYESKERGDNIKFKSSSVHSSGSTATFKI
jgi:hypothetical protein